MAPTTSKKRKTSSSRRRKRRRRWGKCKCCHSHNIVRIKWNIYRRPSVLMDNEHIADFDRRTWVRWWRRSMRNAIIIDNARHFYYFVYILRRQKSMNTRIPFRFTRSCTHWIWRKDNTAAEWIPNRRTLLNIHCEYRIITNNYLLKSNKHSICDAKDFSTHLIMIIIIMIAVPSTNWGTPTQTHQCVILDVSINTDEHEQYVGMIK